MKNFSKALVLSVAMLVAGSAKATDKTQAVEVANRLEKIGSVVTDFQKKMTDKYMHKYMTFGDVKALEAVILDCQALLGNVEVSATLRAKVAAILNTLQTAVRAELSANYSKELAQLALDIDALVARIEKSYKKLYYKDNVYPREKGQLRKLAVQAILNDNVYGRIAAQAA